MAANKSCLLFVLQTSGLPLSLSVKIQINMHFQNLKAFRQLERFSYLTIPMLWFDIVSITPQLLPLSTVFIIQIKKFLALR